MSTSSSTNSRSEAYPNNNDIYLFIFEKYFGNFLMAAVPKFRGGVGNGREFFRFWENVPKPVKNFASEIFQFLDFRKMCQNPPLYTTQVSIRT